MIIFENCTICFKSGDKESYITDCYINNYKHELSLEEKEYLFDKYKNIINKYHLLSKEIYGKIKIKNNLINEVIINQKY